MTPRFLNVENIKTTQRFSTFVHFVHLPLLSNYSHLSAFGGEYVMSFDKNKYNAEYQKNHYVRKTVRLKPDLAQEIDIFCNWRSLSFNELIVLSVKSYIEQQTGSKLDI